MTHLFKLMLALATCWFSSLALAHVGLAMTVPDHDAVLEHIPTQIQFRFGSEVTLTNLRLEFTSGPRKGERLNLRLPRNSIGQSIAFGTDIAVELPIIEAATYQVWYQAISIDGHVLVDDFSFTVSNGGK